LSHEGQYFCHLGSVPKRGVPASTDRIFPNKVKDPFADRSSLIDEVLKPHHADMAEGETPVRVEKFDESIHGSQPRETFTKARRAPNRVKSD
jgi:hypothetical protein